VIESELVLLVEQHRHEQLMSLPPVDLLAVARRERSRRRRRAATITGGVFAGVVLVAASVHAIGATSGAGHAASPPTQKPRVTPLVPAPSTRLVGLNGWVVRVPATWGTDQVGCDGSTPIHPTVVFDHHSGHPRVASSCVVRSNVPYIRITDATSPGPPCRTCAVIEMSSSSVTFEIHARTRNQMRVIEDSLQQLSSRQTTVPVWRDPTGALAAPDQMTTISRAAGLRPHVLEVPSREPPGVFLNSDPPMGTPVDLGRNVTLFHSAGDLGRYASSASLQRNGWRLSAVSDFEPPYGRPAAIRAAGGGGATTDAFLRTLTITHEGPRHVLVQRRLAWLVVTASGDRRNEHLATITAVDAGNGHVLETRTGFRGRSR
jgi:hypothetical protein